MRKLQKAVKEDIRSRLRFSYAPPREEALTLNRAMLFYLDQTWIYTRLVSTLLFLPSFDSDRLNMLVNMYDVVLNIVEYDGRCFVV